MAAQCSASTSVRAPNNEAAIRDLSRVSRPGCRVYVGRDEIKRVQSGLGISIMTTPRGVMTGRQARREGVGGEILCGSLVSNWLQWNGPLRDRDSQAVKGRKVCRV